MIFLHEIYSSVYLTNENLGTDFPTWNVDFSSLALETLGTELSPRKYEILVFHIGLGINKVTWNMEFFIFSFENLCADFLSWNTEYCIFNNWKIWHQFSYKKYGIFYFIHKVIFMLEVWSHYKYKYEVNSSSRWWTGRSKTLRMWSHLIVEHFLFWNSESR